MDAKYDLNYDSFFVNSNGQVTFGAGEPFGVGFARPQFLMNSPQIAGLYDLLLRADPSPVVELNRAVAVAMLHGPAAGLALIDAILARGELADYHLAHSARADLCRRPIGCNAK